MASVPNRLNLRSAPVPRSLDTVEDARLAALPAYRGLPQQDVAGLTRLSQEAACSLGATHAAVSFVDETSIWYGGAFGFAGVETSRKHSFCDAVVQSMAPLLVPDGRDDPRFRLHDLVCGGPGLRCYAGAPLIDGRGHVLGTVAAYSTEPAVFVRETLLDLVALAGLVREFLAESRPSVALVQGWLGVKTLKTDGGARGETTGLMVLSVAKGSPAALAGLRPTDILHAIGGRELFVASDVAAALTGRALGSLVQIKFRRAGQWHRGDVTIKSRKTRLNGPWAAGWSAEGSRGRPGLGRW